MTKKDVKILTGAIIIIVIAVVISLVYAGFTGQLNINGNAVGRESNWDIHFENVSSITTTGTAKVLNSHEPVINSNNRTQIQDYEVSLTSPKDSISFTFDVVNNGNYNAKITSIDIDTPECISTDQVSATNMCNNLTYTLTDINGASINVNDIIYAKDKISLKVILSFNDISDPSLLPKSGVSISNLGIEIDFEQEGNALVKDNGEVADYRVYHQGDKITLNNEDYYIIANSGADKDYVVVLKDTPLTVAEVNLYGGVGTDNNHVNKYDMYCSNRACTTSGYGGMAYYNSETCGYMDGSLIQTGCTNNYDDSDIKYIVDAWEQDKFLNNELKEVDGYKARLITVNELVNELGCTSNNCANSSYSWTYKYIYWISTPLKLDNRDAYIVSSNGSIRYSGVFRSYGELTVRPVINVYKSVLENN